MKKAVISTGSKQYLVSENDVISVELIDSVKNDDLVKFDTMLLIDGDSIEVGKPLLDKSQVEAKVISSDYQADKVTAIRFKAKKRVKKVHGHRQRLTKVQITKI